VRTAARQGGIGIVIQPNEEGAMTIMRLVEDGPAEESGKVRVNFEFKWNFMRAAGSGRCNVLDFV
jgi:hypothetical protein